jgi:hypothetical protein
VAIARVYNIDVNLVNGIPVGTGGVPGTEYVCLYGQTAQEFNVSAIRVNTVSGSGAYYPSNGTITWRLRRVAGTNSGILVGTATAAAIGQSTTAAQSTWYYSTANGSGTATFATMGQVLWSQTTPLTAGANWGEWYTPGFELNASPQATGTLALTYELGSAGSISAVGFSPEVVISE